MWEDHSRPVLTLPEKLVMNPMHEFRGLCLASTATQIPGGSALASSTDTSGLHDNQPVHTQTCRVGNVCSVRRYFTLAVEASLLRSSGTQLAAWAGIPRTVSPCVQWDMCRQWPVTQQGALAQRQYSTNVQKKQAGTPTHAPNKDSPFLPTHRMRGTPGSIC